MTTADARYPLSGREPEAEPPAEVEGAAEWRGSRLGFWSSILTSGLALASLAIGVATPPRSGPNCLADCIAYPYTDAAAFVPRDYIWIYPTFLLALTFVVLAACVHHHARVARRQYSQLALSFALVGAAVLGADYFVQLAVLQPSLLKGETVGLSLFSMYNPHGIFIALEDLGWLTVSVSCLFASAVFVGHGRLERAVRWLFLGSSLLAIGALVGLAAVYGADLEYRFEVMVLAIAWLTLIAAGPLLAVWFRPTRQRSASAG